MIVSGQVAGTTYVTLSTQRTVCGHKQDGTPVVPVFVVRDGEFSAREEGILVDFPGRKIGKDQPCQHLKLKEARPQMAASAAHIFAVGSAFTDLISWQYKNAKVTSVIQEEYNNVLFSLTSWAYESVNWRGQPIECRWDFSFAFTEPGGWPVYSARRYNINLRTGVITNEGTGYLRPMTSPSTRWYEVVFSGTEAIDYPALLEICPRIEDIPISVKTQVFQNACQAFEGLDMNNLENLKQVLDSVLSLFKRDVKGALQLPESIHDLWLWYRYSYCTSRSDLRSLEKEIPGLKASLAALHHNDYYSGHGVVDTPDYRIRCRLAAKPKFEQDSSDLSTLLDKLGISLTLSNVWDLIPFSFIVDWFLPVQSLLKSVDMGIKYNYSTYQFSSIVYSRDQDLTFPQYPGIVFNYYERWLESSPPMWGGWYDNYDPSTKTVVKRFIDGICLMVSGRR